MSQSQARQLDKAKLRKISLIIIAILFVSVLFVIYLDDIKDIKSLFSHVQNRESVIYSKPTGIYKNNIDISLKLDYTFPSSAVILCTTDGDDPKESDVCNLPIHLEAPEQGVSITPLKTRVLYKSELSDVRQNTYLLTNDDSYLNLPVISITSNKYNLYDYKTGILVPGARYDYEKTRTKEGQYIYGNYNNIWTRDARITAFYRNEILLDRSIGLSVSGRTSAELPIKSFTIRGKYGDIDNKIKLDLINQNKDKSEISILNEYNSIKLKSGSQDQYRSNIRASVINRLAYDSDFYAGTTTNRAVMFLNGEFYGIFDIQESQSKSVFAKRFSLEDTSKIEIIKGGEAYAFEQAGILNLFKADLSKKENQAALEEKVDIDDMMMYYSIELLTNNLDWYHANYAIWRYTGKSDDANMYSDGRYRFMLYDVDGTYHKLDKNKQSNKFNLMINDNDSLFAKILKVKKYRDKFVTTFLRLSNSTFSTQNVLAVIDEEYDIIEPFNKTYLSENKYKSLEKGVRDLKDGAKSISSLKQQILDYFKYSGSYSLTISSDTGTNIIWDNDYIASNQSKVLTYPEQVKITLTYALMPGYKFGYWDVNGEKIYDKSISISSKSIKNGKVLVSATSIKDINASIIIDEMCANDDSDWIKIKNISDHSIRLDNYYLSDSRKNTQKYKLPAIYLNSDETIVINGKKNYYAIGDYICNFNIKSGEEIFLFDKSQDKIIESHIVPRMSSIESYGRDESLAKFIFYNNLNSGRKKHS